MKTAAIQIPKITETPALVSARSELGAIHLRIFELEEKRRQRQAQIDQLVMHFGVLREARGVLDAFDTAQAQRLREWITSGCVGERPEPDRKARAKLSAALLEVEGDQRVYDEARAKLADELASINNELPPLRLQEETARLHVVNAVGESLADTLRARADEAHHLAVLVNSWRQYAHHYVTPAQRATTAPAYGTATDPFRPDNRALRMVLEGVQRTVLAGDDFKEFNVLCGAWTFLFEALTDNAAAKYFGEPVQEAELSRLDVLNV